MKYATEEEFKESFHKDYVCEHRHGMNRFKSICSDGRVQIREICFLCGKTSTSLKRQDGDDGLAIITSEERNEITTAYHDRRNEERNRIAAEFANAKIEKMRTAYHAYLQTDKWQAKRKAILERDKHLCQGCLHARATVVHHLTYDNVKDELAFQLISLCRTCHARIHEKETNQ